eukprot:TRINITY_DN43445_c0_g1_i1.p1 TRINITY_DN43445_c0_g1~~TRINITY_DN43445_c0_g1_i1.p1  ORF type:complete len:540 (+),score=123.38 TRINITY_DN43445_c0_g1_i1:62-1621(+)
MPPPTRSEQLQQGRLGVWRLNKAALITASVSTVGLLVAAQHHVGRALSVPVGGVDASTTFAPPVPRAAVPTLPRAAAQTPSPPTAAALQTAAPPQQADAPSTAPAAAAGAGSAAGRCVTPADELGARATWADVCKLAQVPVIPASSSGFAIAVTTYRGHETFDRMFSSWGHFGLLASPMLRGAAFHVNRCTRNDTDFLCGQMQQKAPGLPHSVTCSSANRLHPMAMVVVIAAAMKFAPYVLFSENDRPLHHYHDLETQPEAVTRIGRFLTAAMQVVANPDTPHVLLERQPHRSLVHANETAAGTECWHWCRKWLPAAGRRRLSKMCSKLEKPVFKGKVVWTNQWDNCAWKVCREWGAFTDAVLSIPDKVLRGRPERNLGEVRKKLDGFGPSQCLTLWMGSAMEAASAAFRKRLVFMHNTTDDAHGTLIVCAKTRGWSNGPGLVNASWWMRGIAGPMCRTENTAKKAGMIMLGDRAHFGRYGRAMERFVDGWYDGGVTKCLGDGIMDHVELEGYDSARVG